MQIKRTEYDAVMSFAAELMDHLLILNNDALTSSRKHTNEYYKKGDPIDWDAAERFAGAAQAYRRALNYIKKVTLRYSGKRKTNKKEIKKMSLYPEHEIVETEDYIFPSEVNPSDLDGLRQIAIKKLAGVKKLNLYVAELTTAAVEVINLCNLFGIDLTIYHFNKSTGTYFPQIVWRI